MEKFNKLAKPIDLDLYEIFIDENGKKAIHVLGCTYAKDAGTYWGVIDICGCIIPLDEFIAHDNGVGGYVEKCKQYMNDASEDEALRIIHTYFDGNPPEYELSYCEITMDTPCGKYACKY